MKQLKTRSFLTWSSVIYLLLCLLTSCSRIDEQASEIQQITDHSVSTSESQYLRTTDQAKSCVERFLAEELTLRSASGNDLRQVEDIIDLSKTEQLRAVPELSDFADLFYIVTLRNNEGYAVVSKDTRCFPVFAVLDKDTFQIGALTDGRMQTHIENMVAGATAEKRSYNQLKSANSLRNKGGSVESNSENALQDMQDDKWVVTKKTGIRTNTKWGQEVKRKDFYFRKEGVPYSEAYSEENIRLNYNNLRSSPSNADAFGCTTVAFGQVIYALRNFPGFNTLRYTNGEKVLWERMDSEYSTDIENQRFLGWLAANCKPTYFDEGTMVLNINATKFLRSKVGNYINSRYDNCVPTAGDFDGYGWSEDRRVAEDFFNHDHAFVIMTASKSALNFVSYHSYVVDGMVELHKRINNKGFLGTGLFSKWRDGIRHLYHVNAGWRGYSNGYYLYVQNIGNKFNYTGTNGDMDYRSKTAYLILWPNQENK